MKSRDWIRHVILLVISGIILVGFSCCNGKVDTPDYLQTIGYTMGTTYKVTYQHDHDLASLLDSTLIAINLSLSTYNDTSTIGLFNSSDIGYLPDDEHFKANIAAAKEIYEVSDRMFDPTIMPLVNYWGFGYTEKNAVEVIDSSVVDSLHSFVGFDRLLDRIKTQGDKRGFQLDFSAIAKGYAVDILSELLTEYDVDNYLVDVGGEVKAHGVNVNGLPWRVGINMPEIGAPLTDIIQLIELTNASMATSGNYRNYYEVDGRIYGHTINPKTAYPEYTSLLSVTVITRSCMFADALTTASMVLGYDDARQMIDQRDGAEACFIIADQNNKLKTIYTDGFIQFLARKPG